MEATFRESIENVFASLSPEEKIAIISHGIALHLSALKKHLFLALTSSDESPKFLPGGFHLVR